MGVLMTFVYAGLGFAFTIKRLTNLVDRSSVQIN
jgi:hypothetical protein